MKKIAVPVLLSAFVLPGTGQIYNRERFKGYVLMGVFLLLSVALFVAILVSVVGLLPPNVASMSFVQLQDYVEQLEVEDIAALRWLWWATVAVWAYGIFDAFLGGLARRKAEPSSTTDPLR